jgi:TonB-linked SusC/RagA family outer membrane protein
VKVKLADGQELESILSEVLRTHKLQYQKLGEKLYVIQRVHKNEVDKIEQSPNHSTNFEKLLPPIQGLHPNVNVLQKTISGTVTDQSTGEPLPGVNVLGKGTTAGTVTGIDGNYRITLEDEVTTLIFSSIGYTSQEVEINGRSTINIAMAEDIQSLEEVVVVGYGTVKKKDLTGAVGRIEAEDFEKQASTSVLEFLSGTVAGFNSNQNASASGGGSLEVRGRNSLNANTEPLIVLDGVIYNGSLQDINPADIESVDILKDASSAAVFGARAASGVVLVTTKKGIGGKPKINLSSKVGIASPARDFKPFDADGYLDFRRDYFRVAEPREEYYYHNPAELPNNVPLEEWRNYSNNPQDDNTQEWLGRLNFFDPEVENYIAGNTVDWYDEVMQSGVRQMHDLSISGKKDNISYFWSIGYTNNEGIIRGDQFSTVRSRLNLDAAVNDWLNVGVNAQYADRNDSAIPADLGDMYRVSPYGSFFSADGTINQFPHEYPLASHPLIDNFEKEELNTTNSLFAVTYANVKLPLGFNFKVSFQNRYQFDKNYNFWPSTTPRGGRNNPNGIGLGERTDSQLHEWMVDNILSWNKTFGLHTFNATFLYNVEKLQRWSSFQTNANFAPNENLGYSGLQFGTNPSVSNNDGVRTGDALMARVNYNFDERYLITASVRRDGFSAFGQQNPRAVFPAIALGWRLSEESFFPNSGWFERLKLRASWGVNGNRSVGDYAALARLGQNLYLDGSGVVVGVFNSTLANPGLQWEQTEAINLGIDFGLFNNRIDGSIELYSMTTNDLLLERRLPEITGYESITTNLGEILNQGVEFSLNTVNVDNQNFSWRSGVVFSLNRNEIQRLWGDTEEVEVNGEVITREVPDIANRWFPGQAIDRIWDYDIIGIWQQNEEELADEYGLAPGDFKAVDVNGDGSYRELDDKVFLGWRDPRYRIGFRNDFTFLKNFTASVFIRGDIGHSAPMGEFRHGSSNVYDRVNTFNLPYWTPENASNEYPKLDNDFSGFEGNVQKYLSRSFIRIQDITLSYNIPKTAIERIGMDNASVFTSIRNLYSFDNWLDWDPESGSTPMPRIITFGVNVSL